jgi:hypothetical protein
MFRTPVMVFMLLPRCESWYKPMFTRSCILIDGKCPVVNKPYIHATRRICRGDPDDICSV